MNPYRTALLVSTAFAFSAACLTRSPSNATLTRPNVIVFLVDDLGWQDTSEPFHSVRTPLNARYHTPNVERLAERGAKFTNAYASAPVCTPTRTSLMTGRSPAANHITYWTLHADADTTAPNAAVRAPAWNVNGLQRGDTTLARLLQSAGYRTIHVGKAHFGAIDTGGADPRALGFDVNVAGHGPGAPGSYYGTHAFAGGPRAGADEPTVWDVPGMDAYHGREIFLTEALALEAVREVRAAVTAKTPFYLYFAPYAVHTPLMANPRYLDRYGELGKRDSAYATMVESVDVALGVLLDLTVELGIRDDTIVVYSSDNGGLSAHSRDGEPHVHNAPLRSGKGSAYEGGVRVPQIISWPGVTDTGSTIDTPVITHDLFPTILAWTGVATPEQHAQLVEGVDLGPIVRNVDGARDALRERTLAWHQPHTWGAKGPGIWPFTSIRRGSWKLIFRHMDRGFELYDLAADVGETRDLADSSPERVRALARELSDWLIAVDAQPSIDLISDRELELPRHYAPRPSTPTASDG